MRNAPVRLIRSGFSDFERNPALHYSTSVPNAIPCIIKTATGHDPTVGTEPNENLKIQVRRRRSVP